MEGFCDAYQENREILRFHFHHPNAILHRLEQAQIPAEVFPLDGQFKEERPTFITEDEINEVQNGVGAVKMEPQDFPVLLVSIAEALHFFYNSRQLLRGLQQLF